MKHLKVWLLIMVCASAFAVPGRAVTLSQTQSDSLLARIDSRMAILDALIFSDMQPPSIPNALAAEISCAPDTVYSKAVDAVVDARIGIIKAETGIQITGQTYYRPDAALGIDEEDDDVSRYIGKIQAEARWYFLQSGLINRKGRIEELMLKGDIDRLEHERGRSEPGLYAQREQLRTVSDSTLASIMLHRVENLNLLEEAYLYLLNNENISGDELLKILDDRAEAERRLSTISTLPTRAPLLSAPLTGTVEIDTTAVLSALAETDIDLQLLSLRSRLLDRQALNTSWWTDVRIAPFVRYSHYFRHNMRSSANVDMGVSFTIPVNSEAARKRTALIAEKGLLDCNRDDMLTKAADKIRYIALETERLNRAIVGEWNRAASLREYLKTRRNAYNNRLGEYNRLAALKEYNSYIRCLENIVEMQYRRDSLLADLQTIIPAVPVLDFCSFSRLTN